MSSCSCEVHKKDDKVEKGARGLAAADPSRFFDIFEVTQAKQVRFKKAAPSREIRRNIKFQGLVIAVETDRGEHRYWKDHDGSTGKTKMNYPYGYIRKTDGADGEEIDVFVGPNTASKDVYIIHQRKKPGFTAYDEDKVMVGFESPREAKAAYLEHYSDRRFFGSMTQTTMDDFKRIFTDVASKSIGDVRAGHKYIKREGEPGAYKYTYTENAGGGDDHKAFIESALNTKLTLKDDSENTKSALTALRKSVEALSVVMDLDQVKGLKNMSVGVTKDYGAGGVVHAVYDFDDKSIAIDENLGKETFHHEFGHFMDHVIGGHGKHYSTELSGKTSKWIDQVRNTKTAELWRGSWRNKRPEFGNYLNKGTEIFARFFDQWVNTKLKEKGLEPEQYHSDHQRVTQEDADRFSQYGEPETNEPFIADKGLFTKEDFEALRPAFEELISPFMKKALERFMDMQKNMDAGLVGTPPPPPMPMMPPMGMGMPGMGMGMMGPPPTDVETFEGVQQLLGRIGTVPDQALMEIASTIWGNGYMFEGQPPDQARQEIIGFLLDQRDLLGIAPDPLSMQPSPELPGQAAPGSSDYSAVSTTSAIAAPPGQQPGVPSSIVGSPDQQLMNWFEQDLSQRTA